VSSSSDAKSSSSVAQSSSSQAVSSSSQGEVVSGTATLTKHGSGSAKQEVKQGESIEEFYFTVAGATGATVTGLPDGIVGTMKGSDFYISGTVAQNAAVGAYNFTVTTTGATTNATKNGTITVVGANGAVAESSSSSVESSSSKVDSSSSSEQGTTSLDVAAIAPHFNVTVDGRVLTVQGTTQAAYLLDAQGRLITKVQSLGSESSVTVPRAGMYLLRVGHETRRITVR
jgi:pectate lyase